MDAAPAAVADAARAELRARTDEYALACVVDVAAQLALVHFREPTPAALAVINAYRAARERLALKR